MRYLKNVASLQYSEEDCTGCGRCIEVCPHNVFKLQARKITLIDIDSCMECGACMMNCAFGAIYVQKGVGCASAIINGAIRGTEPSCGCCDDEQSGRSGCCC